MLTLAVLGCALVCLSAGLATTTNAPRDGQTILLVALQLVGGAVLGWLIGWLMNLTPAETAGLALVGAAPGTVAAVPFVALAGGSLKLANGMLALSGFVGLGTVFLTALLAGGASTFTLLILGAALPFWAGLALRDQLPPIVHRFAPILAGLVLAALIVAGLFLGSAGAAFGPLFVASVLLAVALTLLGNAVDRALSQGGVEATTATIAIPMRNIAVPMLAGFSAGLTAAPMAAAIYGIVMYLPALVIVFARVRKARS